MVLDIGVKTHLSLTETVVITDLVDIAGVVKDTALLAAVITVRTTLIPIITVVQVELVVLEEHVKVEE